MEKVFDNTFDKWTYIKYFPYVNYSVDEYNRDNAQSFKIKNLDEYIDDLLSLHDVRKKVHEEIGGLVVRLTSCTDVARFREGNRPYRKTPPVN